ncbi:hypothetical protein A6456_27640 [Paraburkholderia tropica]|nr:hypothetical protein A6456_27640 [Paraburkholderia tropica]
MGVSIVRPRFALLAPRKARCYDSSPAFNRSEQSMKPILLALAALGILAAGVSSAQAGVHHECHKVRVHKHWEKHCR